MSAEIHVRTRDDHDDASLAEAAYRQRRHRRRLLINLTRVGILVAVIGGWQLWVGSDQRKVILYGVPSGILGRLHTWIQEGTTIGSLGAQIVVTLEEAILGFIIGTALGILCGVALGRVRFLADVFGPFIKMLNSIPRIVLGSVFILAFGLGLESKVLLVIVLVFFGVFFNAFQGTREVDRNFIANATSLGASRWQVTRQVVLPSAFTWITASLHVSFGFALVGAVVGEFLGARQGIGLLIATAQGTFNSAGVFAAMIVLGVVALIAEFAITRLENVLVKWRPAQFTDTGY